MSAKESTRRDVIKGIGAAGGATLLGLKAGESYADNEQQIEAERLEPHHMGKNTDLDGAALRLLDIGYYPRNGDGGGGKLSQGLQGIKRFLSGGVEPAPADGGGQYQGNPQSAGNTETGKDPLTRLGEAQVIARPGANLSTVSLNGITATGGNGSLEVYENGTLVESFDKGTETIPLLTNGGSTVFGADATGLYKYDVASGTLEASFDDTGSQGALKILDGVIGVEADGAADFFDAEDLSRVSEVSNSGPTLRSLAFASSNNAIYTDGQGVEGVDPETGKVNWQVDPFGNRVASAGGATNGDVYVATDSAGRAHIIDVADGSRKDTLDIGEAPSLSSPVDDGEGGWVAATEKATRFDQDLNKVWEQSLNGRAAATAAIDDRVLVSTTNSVQMLDKTTGELVDEVLADGSPKALGMPRGGSVPVIDYGSSDGTFYEVPLQRTSSGGDRDPPGSFVDELRLETYKDDPSESKPTVGETTELDVIFGLGDAPGPVVIGYELVLKHEGASGRLTDSIIVQPNETADETYPLETERSSTDVISSNGTGFSGGLHYEDDSDPGNETIRANSTLDNSTYAD